MHTISLLSLIWCVIPIIITGYCYHSFGGKLFRLNYATVRMLLQLIAVGYLLVVIFNNPSMYISILIIIFMLIMASWIAINTMTNVKTLIIPAIVSLSIAVVFHLVISLKLVINVEHWYLPRVLIPLAGMYFANGMNSLSLATERYFAELRNSVSAKTAASIAFNAAMIPQINGLFAVGLVSLPGMMTGQILSGVSPLEAVRYQVMIMTMMLGVCGLGVAIMLKFLQFRHNR